MKHKRFNESDVMKEYAKIMQKNGMVKEASVEEVDELSALENALDAQIKKIAQQAMSDEEQVLASVLAHLRQAYRWATNMINSALIVTGKLLQQMPL